MKYILAIFLLLFFTGCSVKQDKVNELFQSDDAIVMKDNYNQLQTLLSKFKTKLDKRNPRNFSRDLNFKIQTDIQSGTNTTNLVFNSKKIFDYKDYLQIAFLPQKIENRNDYLILGIHKLIFDAFDANVKHKFIAMSYNKAKLKSLHYNLQILKWKIKVDRDINGEYLFLTWQNNWQVELERRLKNGESLNKELINDLYYLKTNKESLFDHSNFSFEVLLTKMIDNVESSMRLLGMNATDLSIDAIKTMIMFI